MNSEDFIGKIKASLHERTYSPLLFCLIGSWLFYNYDLVIWIFSDQVTYNEKVIIGVSDKISNIRTLIDSKGAQLLLCKPFLHGFIAFIFWCILHPLSVLSWDAVKKLIKYIRHNHLDKINTVPESIKISLEDKILELEQKHREQISLYKMDNEELKSKSDELTNRLSSSSIDKDSLSLDINRLKEEIIDLRTSKENSEIECTKNRQSKINKRKNCKKYILPRRLDNWINF
ncbi:MAG: hypothetical protein R3E67_02225 [Pseudomonadales bacterium]